MERQGLSPRRHTDAANSSLEERLVPGPWAPFRGLDAAVRMYNRGVGRAACRKPTGEGPRTKLLRAPSDGGDRNELRNGLANLLPDLEIERDFNIEIVALKSSDVPITPRAVWCFPVVELSNEPTFGSTAITGWQGLRDPLSSPRCAFHQVALCRESPVIFRDAPDGPEGQTASTRDRLPCRPSKAACGPRDPC